MNINLPKKYLSYSSCYLWTKDKKKFRERYYEGIIVGDTPYTLFGREVHEQIENEDKYKSIRLPKAEHKMMVDVGSVPIMGYIDTYDPDTHAFGEYKSGIRKPNGSPRWDNIEVQKLDQLPWYSLLLQEKYGAKINETYLVWLETVWNIKEKKYNGVTLELGKKLELTGEYEIFKRKIYQYDRDRIKKWIIKSAKEISRDYAKYQKEIKGSATPN